MCDVMELSVTDVLPTVKVINRLIFMPSPSVATCMLAIVRPRDFAVLLKNSCSVPPLRPRIKRFSCPTQQRYRFSQLCGIGGFEGLPLFNVNPFQGCPKPWLVEELPVMNR
jgi:hypothetical protein